MRIRHLPNLKRIATDIGQAQPTNPGIAGQLYTYGLTCVQALITSLPSLLQTVF